MVKRNYRYYYILCNSGFLHADGRNKADKDRVTLSALVDADQ